MQRERQRWLWLLRLAVKGLEGGKQRGWHFFSIDWERRARRNWSWFIWAEGGSEG